MKVRAIKGQTLFDVSVEQFGSAVYWVDLLEANKQQLVDFNGGSLDFNVSEALPSGLVLEIPEGLDINENVLLRIKGKRVVSF